MIGRGAQGRPWFPGQVARFLATGRREAPPALERQLALVTDLYDEIARASRDAHRHCSHARKHLGWALDAAAETAGVPDALLARHWRAHVLTDARTRAPSRRGLADAFAAFGWRAAA